jgi:hypothetical protein
VLALSPSSLFSSSLLVARVVSRAMMVARMLLLLLRW